MRKYTYGFTLLELMIVITIVGIISMATYIPYAHHQKKVAIKTAAREISQSLSSARNLAINGLDTGSGNLNIGLYFASGAQLLETYVSTGSLSLTEIESQDSYSEKKFPRGVQIESVDNQEEFLFVFDAITGSGSMDPFSSGDMIPIQISYGGATSSLLQHELEYYKNSYITDY